jgi:hypothetical protein
MATYKIVVKETLQQIIEIDANSIKDAINQIKEQYKSEKIVLTDHHYVDTDFFSLEDDDFRNEKLDLINEILEYLLDEGKKHFEAFDVEPKNHIYKKLLRLKDLNKQ